MNRMVAVRIGVATIGIAVQVLTIALKLSVGRADPVYDSWILVGAAITAVTLLSIVWTIHKNADGRASSRRRHLTINPS